MANYQPIYTPPSGSKHANSEFLYAPSALSSLAVLTPSDYALCDLMVLVQLTGAHVRSE